MGFASDGNRELKSTGEVGEAKAIFKACCGIGKLFGAENHDWLSNMGVTTNPLPEKGEPINGNAANSTRNSSSIASTRAQGEDCSPEASSKRGLASQSCCHLSGKKDGGLGAGGGRPKPRAHNAFAIGESGENISCGGAGGPLAKTIDLCR